MRRSKGFRSKTRRSMHKKASRNNITVSLQQFDVGSKVAIVQNPSIVNGMPHPRFKGKIGKIVESRGLSYMVQIKDGNKTKLLLSRPEHIKLV